MARDWCVWIPFDDEASAESAAGCLRINDLDAESEGTAVWVYCAKGRNPKRLEKEAMHLVRLDGLAGALAHYPRILRWDERDQGWLDTNEPQHVLSPGELALAPALTPTDARWAVSVVPSSIFARRRAQAQLKLLDRPFLPDDGHHLVLGAADAADARALCEAAKGLPTVRDATASELSWFDRWRLREHYLGNYGERDPTTI